MALWGSICNMNPSSNLFLIGPMGAGKTSIGRRLAEQLDLPFIDLDEKIESDTGARIALIFELEGEAGFRARERAALLQFSATKGIVLGCGGGVILDPDNRACLHERGFVVYLQASVANQLQRLHRDRQRPLLASADREPRLHAMATLRNPLYEQTADLITPTHDENVARASARVLSLIEAHWQRVIPMENP